MLLATLLVSLRPDTMPSVENKCILTLVSILTGLMVLPYIFGSELWPNNIRSFGTAFGSTFHWIFVYAIKYSVPPLLSSTHNWGAFIFFAGWCGFAWLYVFFMVPEVAGMEVEEIDRLFEGPWFKAYRTRPKHLLECIDGDEEDVKASQTKS